MHWAALFMRELVSPAPRELRENAAFLMHVLGSPTQREINREGPQKMKDMLAFGKERIAALPSIRVARRSPLKTSSGVRGRSAVNPYGVVRS